MAFKVKEPVEVQVLKIPIAHAFLACGLKGVEGRNGEMSISGRDNADIFIKNFYFVLIRFKAQTAK